MPLAHRHHPCLFFCFTCIYSDVGLTRQLESQHGEGEKEGQEESCEEEVRPFARRPLRRPPSETKFAISCPLRRARSFPGGGSTRARVTGRYKEAARRRGRFAVHSR